jgi:hypothetical protein
MKSQPERLNDQLTGQQASPDPEIKPLVDLSHQVQQAPQLKVHSDFADQLEQRVLEHAAVVHQQKRRWDVSLLALQSRSSLLVSAAVLGVLLVLGCVALILLRNADLGNPLQIRNQMMTPTGISALARAKLHDQQARDYLSLLEQQADPTQAAHYRVSLANFHQSLDAFISDVNALPAGADKTQLQQKVETLKTDARNILRKNLHALSPQEGDLTTSLLATLGEQVPQIKKIQVRLIGEGRRQLQVTVEGENLDPQMRLILDDQVTAVQGQLQNETYVFALAWNGKKPRNLGIINPDGMVRLEHDIQLDDSNSNNGDNGNKPVSTPTPNGNKPVSTPTPHKPTDTPVPPSH